MIVLLEDSLVSIEELWSSVRVTSRVLGHLPDQGPSPPIAQFGRVASSRKSLGGYKLFPLKNNGGLCVLGTFNAAEMFWYRSLDLCRHNPVTELDGQILPPHDLVLTLTCSVNCGT